MAPELLDGQAYNVAVRNCLKRHQNDSFIYRQHFRQINGDLAIEIPELSSNFLMKVPFKIV